MSAYYIDASALVKRYVREPGSPWLNRLVAQTAEHTFLSSELVAVEVMSAFARAHREKRIGAARQAAITGQLESDAVALIRTLPVSGRIIRSAGELAIRHVLRAYDAVHLASALELRNDLARLSLDGPTFVTADAELLSAAGREGLTTENPNDHP